MLKKILLVTISIISLIVIVFLLSKEKEPKEVEIINEIYDYVNEQKDEKDEVDNKYEVNDETSGVVDEVVDNYDYEAEYDDSSIEVNPKNVYKEIELEDIFDKKDIKDAKNLALEFIENYHNFNGSSPMDSIENTREIITDELYDYLVDNMELTLHYSYFKEFKEAEYHPYPLTENDLDIEDIPLIYYVKGVDKDPTKKESKETMDVYLIIVSFTDEGLIVSGMVKNMPF